jgi:SPP1 family predicted phage head-tail adaptor
MDRLRAGSLRHNVTLQRFVQSSTDDRGHPVGSWEDVAYLRCSISPVGPRDADIVNQLYHEATHVIWMRYHTGVNIDTRLAFGDRKFHVGHVANIDERNAVLKLLCTEVV